MYQNILATSKQSKCYQHNQQTKSKKERFFNFHVCFRTLYLNIAHHRQKFVREKMIKLINCSDKEFIGCYRYVAIWTKVQEKYGLVS